MKTHKQILSAVLVLLLCLGLLPTAALAAAPAAGLRDMQTHVWTNTLQTEPEKETVTVTHYRDRLNQYRVSGQVYPSDAPFTGPASPAHFMLYDNGDLYISLNKVPSINTFRKLLGNVKEIGSVKLPLYKYQYRLETSYGSYSTNTHRSINETETAEVTVILTEDGSLYIMGCPKEIPHELCSLAAQSSDSYASMYNSITAENVFPFSYSDSHETLRKVASGISQIRADHEDYESVFYVDKQGNGHIGFPSTDKDEAVDENVLNVDNGIRILEDGTLNQYGKTIAQNVKDFNRSSYLTNDGKMYLYNSSEAVAYDVKAIYRFMEPNARSNGYYDYYIKEDDSLWRYAYGGGKKVMEDVAAMLGGYAVRTNGDVFELETDSYGMLGVRKILDGSGYAPAPAPALHAGKIFKDASSWAMIDLRAARESGLTVPTDGLSYDQPITREKFAEVAVKLYEALSGKKAVTSAANPFTDTSNPEILKAYSLGIVNGTSATTFSPDTQITREGIATMLMRTVNAAGVTLPNISAVQFADGGEISSWAKDAVDAMARANIVKGVGNDRFNPQGTATVEQAIIMANRVLQ